jgi:hypothetical protein
VAARLVAPAPVRELRLAISGPGARALAWLATACSTTEYHAGPVQAAALRAGRVGAPAVVTGDPAFGVSLAAAPSGGAEAAWTASPPEAPGGAVRVARADGSGTFGAPFAPPDGLVAVAADPAGDQVVQRLGPASSGPPASAGVRTADGTVAAAPVPPRTPLSVAPAAPSGRGAVVAARSASGVRVTTWRP